MNEYSLKNWTPLDAYIRGAKDGRDAEISARKKAQKKRDHVKDLLVCANAKSERRRRRLTKCWETFDQIIHICEDRVIRGLCVEALKIIEGGKVERGTD